MDPSKKEDNVSKAEDLLEEAGYAFPPALRVSVEDVQEFVPEDVDEQTAQEMLRSALGSETVQNAIWDSLSAVDNHRVISESQ